MMVLKLQLRNDPSFGFSFHWEKKNHVFCLMSKGVQKHNLIMVLEGGKSEIFGGQQQV